MTKNTDNIRYFLKWLSSDPVNFIKISDNDKNCLKLEFNGIIPEIFALVKNGIVSEIMICADYGGDSDIITSFEAVIKKDPLKGFYCEFCSEAGQAEYFSTAEDLLIAHVYTPFYEYANKLIIPGNFLLLTGQKDLFFTAKIIKEQSVSGAKDDRDFIALLPLKKEYNMGSITAQILIGSAHNFSEGIIISNYLFLSENSRPAWILTGQNIYDNDEESKKNNITWIPSPENMLEDALLMTAIYVCKDKEILKLIKRYGKDINADFIEIDSIFNDEQRKELYRSCRNIKDFPKIIISVFKGSSIRDQLDIISEYGINTEICLSS